MQVWRVKFYPSGERIGLFHILNIYEFSWEGVRLPYQIIFLPNLISCSSLYLFHCIFLSFFHKKRYKLEIDSVGGNKRDKINKGEDKRGKINKAAVLLPYWV